MATFDEAINSALANASTGLIRDIARADENAMANVPAVSVARSMDGRSNITPSEIALAIHAAVMAARAGQQLRSRIVFRYLYMTEIVAFALETLKARSPVGNTGDKHPGLYRDSHMVFIDGHAVSDVKNWQPGQQVNISNPVPYARKIESGRMKMSLPPHIYEDAAQIVASRFGNQAEIKFTFMPVRFGSNQAAAPLSRKLRDGRSAKSYAQWDARQPALEITAR